MKLTRLKASELNIYARGSVHGVQAHLRDLNKSTGGLPNNIMIEALSGVTSAQESQEFKPPLDV